jgi:hypothetical protein
VGSCPILRRMTTANCSSRKRHLALLSWHHDSPIVSASCTSPWSVHMRTRASVRSLNLALKACPNGGAAVVPPGTELGPFARSEASDDISSPVYASSSTRKLAAVARAADTERGGTACATLKMLPTAEDPVAMCPRLPSNGRIGLMLCDSGRATLGSSPRGGAGFPTRVTHALASPRDNPAPFLVP